MRKSVCGFVLLTACAALSLCAPSAVFAGDVVFWSVPNAVAPVGPGTVEVVTGATIARPPLPPPGAAPSVQPDATGDLLGLPPLQPGAAMPVAPKAFTSTHPAPVAGRDNLFIARPAEVRAALARGVQMIFLDVRDKSVRDREGHIAGDAHVPFGPVETFPARVRYVIPNAMYPVIVYCGDGVWSSQAADVLSRMGYRVYLMGAYSLWLRG